MDCGLPTPALRPNTNPGGSSGLWHSALKFGQIIYIGLFPRHVEQCCREAGHVRQEDIGAMHVASKEFDKAVRDKVGGGGIRVLGLARCARCG
jgi:hypothetical protein